MKRYPNTINMLELVAVLEDRDDQQKTINARFTSKIIEIINRLDVLENKPTELIESESTRNKE